MSLSGLSIELVWLICELLDPLSQFNLSLVNKRCADSCQKFLAEYRKRHAVINRCSDRNPESLTKPLHVILNDPFAAWHMHTFDMFGRHFAWGRMGNNRPKFEMFMKNKRLSATETSATRNGAANRILGLKGLYRTPAAVNRACREVNQGGFEAAILLILALCPNLRGLNFEVFAPKPGPGVSESIHRQRSV
jgi:hypothetical protein